MWVMAGVAFREAVRKKMVWMAVAVGAGLLTIFGLALHFQVRRMAAAPSLIRQQVPDALLMVGLYAADLLTMLMTVMASSDALSGEIASGTIHAIATKPIRRRKLLLGKWLGYTGMMTVYLVIMVGGVSAIAYALSGTAPLHVLSGAFLIWLESVLLLNVTLLCGTTFSTLTNGVVVLGLFGMAFLGGWIEQVGAVTQSARAVDVGIIASLIMPSEALWRRAAYEMQSPVLGALRLSPFSSASIPSHAMVEYSVAYLAAALALALHYFGQRDL